MAAAIRRFALLAAGLVALAGPPAWASTTGIPSGPSSFPTTPGDETEFSLGRFTVLVAPAFAPTINSLCGVQGTCPAGPLAGYTGGFFAAPGHSAFYALTSPLLFDPSTTIGVSGSLANGSAADSSGVPVGSANVNVSDGSFAIVPGNFQGDACGGACVNEVHTHIVSFDLTDSHGGASGGGGGSTHVLAGSVQQTAGGVAGPGIGNNFGEVQADTTSGDFPAKSFFDLLVNIDTPLGPPLYNTTPLVVHSTIPPDGSLPPTVVYTHDISDGVVPLYGNFGGGPVFFGDVMLTGHGIGFQDPPGSFDCTGNVNLCIFFQGEATAFGLPFDGVHDPYLTQLGNLQRSNLPADMAMPEPASAALMLAACGALGALHRRRRAS